jgi:hypothetical protein
MVLGWFLKKYQYDQNLAQIKALLLLSLYRNQPSKLGHLGQL